MSPSPLSSTPVLRTILVWSTGVSAVLLVVGAVAGLLVAGPTGLWSAVAGVLVAAVFLAITAASILIANRWYGDPLYVPLFFGIVLGGWILKLVVFVVALMILRGQPWIEPPVFFVALVVSVLAALVVDVIVLLKLRIPAASETTLPAEVPDDDRPAIS